MLYLASLCGVFFSFWFVVALFLLCFVCLFSRTLCKIDSRKIEIVGQGSALPQAKERQIVQCVCQRGARQRQAEEGSPSLDCFNVQFVLRVRVTRSEGGLLPSALGSEFFGEMLVVVVVVTNICFLKKSILQIKS